MIKKSRFLLILFLFISLLLVGCEDQVGDKELRRRDILKEEPYIIVKLQDGQEKKMGLEEYITGVVAGEMKPDWPENAYAAQAIIARTFALKHMSDNNTNIITGSYQFAQEYKPENISSDIEEAVKKTRGEAIVYEDDYINAWFHSSAAGRTTSAKVGLAYKKEEPPYIVSVKSPDDKAPEEVQSWQADFSNSDITEALNKMGENVGNISNIEIAEKDKTGRAISFEFIGDAGSATVEAAVFRNELDSKELKSTMISEIKKTKNGFSFSGSGFGHGVGMSQWGTYALAGEGKSPEEIIEHYFKDIEIVKEYD